MARKKEEAPQGAPMWVVTYGDCMSLLLCFFVMLQAYSTLEIEKFNQAMASLKGALGVMPYQQTTTPVPIVQQRPTKGEIKKRGKKSRAAAALRKAIQENNMGKLVKVGENPNGIHITIADPALFDSGQSTIKPAIFPILKTIVDVIKTGTENIRVEGHTDNVPIHNAQYDDNWELSIDRALSVIRYLRSQEVIDPLRLRPVGCGEFHPVASNDSPEGRSHNRRVEIFIEMID